MENPTTTHEPRHAVAMISTLMPHLAAERHYVYRNATALALFAALIAAAFGSLPIALVLAAVALPAVVLTYVHDHKLWRDEPATVIGLTFALSLALGVGVGFLHLYFTPAFSLVHGRHHLPPVSRILELGVLVPAVAFVAVLIAPLLVTGRAAFRHPMDVAVTSALSGAALSLGLSVVVEHGAFNHFHATAGEPANVAFIALTLGFVQPVILATAAAVTVLGVRSPGANTALGAVEGFVVVVLYGLASTLLAPYGARGLVLTAFAAFVLAGAGLVAARSALHSALHANAAAEPGDGEHRLHGAVVVAVIAVVVIVAAGVTAAVVFGGPSTKPKPPTLGPGHDVIPTRHAAAPRQPRVGQRSESLGTIVLASRTDTLAAGNASSVELNGITLTGAPGWSVTNHDNACATLENSDQSAALDVCTGKADAADINQEATVLINADIKAVGLTNVQPQSLGPMRTVQGNNFQQILGFSYTAYVQTDQGAGPTCGIWMVLFNPTAQRTGFVNFNAGSPDALNAASHDAETMIASML
jgi:hypothetical protein